MPSPSFSRKNKALTIVPVVMLSGAWTANLLGTSAVATGPDRGGQHGTLPDGTRVPTRAIDSPAGVQLPGLLAPGVPDNAIDKVVTGASASGIPAPALAAYQRAAQIIDTADRSCNVPWELLAAIGRVESNHGRTGGSSLDADGVAHPSIYGPVLNGKHGGQAVLDTDGGQLDGNTEYDRAVGPMQFLPSTWQVVKVDADGDGQRNPQDINDAALATAVYLCSGTEDLGTRAGQSAAVYRYNHSHRYVDVVLRIAEAYAAGDYSAVPSGSYGGTLFSPHYATVPDRHHRQGHGKHDKPSARIDDGPSAGEHDSASGDTNTPGTPSPTSSPSTAPGGGQGPLAPLPTPIQSALEPVTDLLGTAQASLLCNSAVKSLLGNVIGLVPDKAVTGVVDQCTPELAKQTPAAAESAAPGLVTGLLKAVLKPLGLADLLG